LHKLALGNDITKIGFQDQKKRQQQQQQLISNQRQHEPVKSNVLCIANNNSTKGLTHKSNRN